MSKDSPLGLSLALLEGVLVLELGSHIGGYCSCGIVLVMWYWESRGYGRCGGYV
jgi:hypothetical protein